MYVITCKFGNLSKTLEILVVSGGSVIQLKKMPHVLICRPEIQNQERLKIKTKSTIYKDVIIGSIELDCSTNEVIDDGMAKAEEVIEYRLIKTLEAAQEGMAEEPVQCNRGEISSRNLSMTTIRAALSSQISLLVCEPL